MNDDEEFEIEIIEIINGIAIEHVVLKHRKNGRSESQHVSAASAPAGSPSSKKE